MLAACFRQASASPATQLSPSSEYLASDRSALGRVRIYSLKETFLAHSQAHRASRAVHLDGLQYLALAEPLVVSFYFAVPEASVASDNPEERGCRQLGCR